MTKMQGLHPYHFKRVQHLTEADFLPRIQFCQWILANQDILPSILWSDESMFTRNGAINIHNIHHWSDENPRVVRRTNFQHRFSVNLWAGIIGDQIIGPIVLPNRLNAEEYFNFLQNDLIDLLPLNVRHEFQQNMHFQHDGAPAHFGRNVRIWLNHNFPGRWIGRGGPIPWPPRSPDLNPLDFYFWGCMKALVYATEVNTREELLQRINQAGNELRRKRFSTLRASQSLVRRARLCLQENGNLFEHLLK